MAADRRVFRHHDDLAGTAAQAIAQLLAAAARLCDEADIPQLSQTERDAVA